MDPLKKTETEAKIFVCRADDLIPEESDTVLLALKRLPPKEAYDRVFRLRRAFQVSSESDKRSSLNEHLKLTPISARSPTNCYPKTSRPDPRM